ncbi:ATP-binding protein [Actinoplanes sp. LDG1-06]|uniref:ATP-binding protein n=1 Tax=Paractinoplanes ovalisporus TaxID=2810368 RepID=A0ABS2AQ27_9ACTN|nr:ATP-binding protein [Actinoplanes ovalisporus]MBM2621336.1 ATP-binding protein [Actinoplanes ovalisporus]
MNARSFETSYAEPGDLAKVRAFVRDRSTGLGLPEERAELLTLAVSELATNTLQHTAGGGVVRLWASDGRVICDVIDGGPIRTLGRTMPAADALRGRGLAIVESICDEVGVETAGDGTRVRLELNLKAS